MLLGVLNNKLHFCDHLPTQLQSKPSVSPPLSFCGKKKKSLHNLLFDSFCSFDSDSVLLTFLYRPYAHTIHKNILSSAKYAPQALTMSAMPDVLAALVHARLAAQGSESAGWELGW